MYFGIRELIKIWCKIMGNKLFLILILFWLLSSCSTTTYLSKYQDINENVYGSLISIMCERSPERPKLDDIYFDGELISCDSISLLICDHRQNNEKYYKIPLSDIKNCYIKFSSESNYYGGLGLLLSLSTISHGFGLLLTFPVNLIMTIPMFFMPSYSFKLAKKTQDPYLYLNHKNLSRFARFPQGLPEDFKYIIENEKKEVKDKN